MRRNLIITFLFVLGAGILTLGVERFFKNPQADFLTLEKGKIVSNFSFETLLGDQKYLHDVEAEEIIIHFWATWCAPCLVELPELIDMTRKNENKVVIAISSDRQKSSIDRFMNKNDISLPDNFLIILDKDREITEGLFSVFRLPESFVLDSNYILKDHILGAYMGWNK